MYETIVLALIPTLIPAVFSYATVRMQTASKKATDELSEKVNKIQLKVDEITEIGKKNNSDIKLVNAEKHKVWGVDLNLSYGNTLAEGKYGKVEYSVSLNNKYRHLASTLRDSHNNNVKDSMYKVSLEPSVTYTTPDFVGFSGSVKVSDELSTVIGSKAYDNGFKVELNANYKKEIETAVGKVVIKPYVSYNLVDTKIEKVDANSKYKNNGKELKTGLKFSLEK